MKFKHLLTKEKKSFTIIIIPPSQKIKQIKIFRWIPTFIILLLLVTSSYFSIKYYNLNNSLITLKRDYDLKVSDLETLTNFSNNQSKELEHLRKKTFEIEKKLSSIKELQSKVKEMVGLNKDAISKPENHNLDVKYRALFTDKSTDLLEFEMDILSESLEETQKDLSKLIQNVDDRLKYLQAKPNLAPTSGRITSKYGWRKNPFGSGREFHYGLDIANNYNTKIKAAGDGIVTYAGYSSGFGRIIIISHGYGYETLYGHNNRLYVKTGDKVKKGQIIALMGSSGRSTGPHVHFEVRYYGKRINPATILNSNK